MNVYEKLSLSRQVHMLAAVSIIGFVVLTILSGASSETIVAALLFSIVLIVLSITLGRFTADRATKTAEALHALADGDLNKRLAITGRDEFAWLSYEYSCTRKAFSAMVSDIQINATQLASASDEMSDITERSREGVVRQNIETELVATAMNEMSCTVQEVARNAASAATAALSADDEAQNGNRVVNQTIETINGLANEVEQTSNVIGRLKDDCGSIGSILDVIRGIADQTNLLALNAAIEAARAGEQGRGFAVVADEVRTLASRTQLSTEEIQAMIKRLQTGADEAVVAMEQGRTKANVCVEQAARAGQSLEIITGMIDQIKNMNTQISIAADQQNAMSEEINRNIHNISEISAETSIGTNQTADASEALASLAMQLQTLVGRFKLAL